MDGANWRRNTHGNRGQNRRGQPNGAVDEAVSAEREESANLADASPSDQWKLLRTRPQEIRAPVEAFREADPAQ